MIFGLSKSSKSAKKPFDWEFSDATNNLHDGKAANGLNYKKSQKKGWVPNVFAYFNELLRIVKKVFVKIEIRKFLIKLRNVIFVFSIFDLADLSIQYSKFLSISKALLRSKLKFYVFYNESI